MHDLPNKASSTNALPIIIKHLKEKGYSFGTLSPQIMPLHFLKGFVKNNFPTLHHLFSVRVASQFMNSEATCAI